MAEDERQQGGTLSIRNDLEEELAGSDLYASEDKGLRVRMLLVDGKTSFLKEKHTSSSIVLCLLTYVVLPVSDHGLIHLNLLAFSAKLHWVLSEVVTHDLSNALDLLSDRSTGHSSSVESIHLETDLVLSVAEVQGEVRELVDLTSKVRKSS